MVATTDNLINRHLICAAIYDFLGERSIGAYPRHTAAVGSAGGQCAREVIRMAPACAAIDVDLTVDESSRAH